MSSDQQFEVADLTWFADKGGFSVTHLRKILIAQSRVRKPPTGMKAFGATPPIIFFSRINLR
jgi:hypothetical protein